jgi:hypothetical protein
MGVLLLGKGLCQKLRHIAVKGSVIDGYATVKHVF